MRRIALPLTLLTLATSCLGGELKVGFRGDPAPADAGPDAESSDGSQSAQTCGNGLVDGMEVCDGNCPTACDDGNACTNDALTGGPSTCDAMCSFVDITACVDDDGCCPEACDAATDNDCSATCGDGVLDENETCDGNCPTACEDGNACTTGRLTGSAANCFVQCSVTSITACIADDGCCPTGCTAATDTDCGAVCGNGMIEGGEVCDGDCPTSCDDQVACTRDRLTGSAQTCDAVCANTPITQCVDGDGCCAPGCHELNDDDCAPVCGNDIVETGETCDGNCPDCDDGVACTADSMTGTAATCNVMCANTPITACVDGDGCCPAACDETNDADCSAVCGNGVVEAGETCDPVADCPTSCNDMNACTTDALVGSAQTCDAVCRYTAITACIDGDGCCAPGCNANTDDDCAAACGNSIVEPGESCDPVADCPTGPADCNDMDACTADLFSGSASMCTAMCTHNPVTACISGDGCCPVGCDTTNDNDCTATCGNGVVEAGETCDPIADCPTSCNDMDACTTDALTGSPTNCTAACQYAPITACVDGDGCCPTACNETNDDDCNASCGNGVVEAGETCDPIADCPTACNDMNSCTTDVLTGSASTCSASCTYTAITLCTDGDGCCAPGCNANNDDDCTPMCGNSVVEPGETCDPAGSCPSSCNDGLACTSDALTGAAATCDASCDSDLITACVDGDGCCAVTCNSGNDDDCPAPMTIDCRNPSTWPSGWATMEALIFDEINRRRTSPQTCNGTGYPAQAAFLQNDELQEAARCHALDMITENFFSHTGSNGSSVGQRANAAGYAWNAIAENIAAGGSTVVGIVNQWMNSTSGHCEAIMSPARDDAGVGYGYGPSTTWKHYQVLVMGKGD